MSGVAELGRGHERPTAHAPGEPAPRRPLHLLEIGLRWPPETFLRERFEGLARRGVKITVGGETSSSGAKAVALDRVELCRLPQGQHRWPRRALSAGADAIALIFRHPTRLPKLIRAARNPPPPCGVPPGEGLTRFRAWARLARLDPDVVHFEWNGSFARFLPLLDLWGCPVVCSTHGSDVSVYPHTTNRPRARAVLAAAFERAAVFHCVSGRLRDEAIALGLDPEKALVIRNAVDVERFRPPAAPRLPTPAARSEFRVVSVGHLRWVKGYEFGVRAIAELRRRGIPARLEIVGMDPDARNGERSERQRILYLAHREGISDHVVLGGETGHREIPEVLGSADAFLQASVSEGLPVAVLEAMACGTPVVCSDAGAIAETIEDGVEGRVVPARDPVALADALASVWTDPDRGLRMRDAARRRVCREFDLAEQLDRFEALYRGLVSR